MTKHFFRIITFAILAGMCMITMSMNKKVELKEVAKSEQLWTGVAVSHQGRIFVCYPRWSLATTVSAAEITQTGEVKPFPDKSWNKWQPSTITAKAEKPQDHFLCVQGVYCDSRNNLWILDTGNPFLMGVVKGGAKLLKIDLKTNRVVRKYTFDDSAAPQSCYLNDVRIDYKKGAAFLTDSGTGAIIVMNLASGKSRRCLANHPSTKSENVVITIDGKKWLRPNGEAPQIHADGLALDNKGEYLYYHSLTGRSLYRIKTDFLLDSSLGEAQLAEKVEFIGKTGTADGIEFGPDGKLYLTSLDDMAIKRYTPGTPISKLEIFVQDQRLIWVDSLSITPDGILYASTSQIHLGLSPKNPYMIFKTKLF
jgi:sugar lactone lactonase YvrE